MTYIGRFAPSPTGLLHFGSLLAALASYLDARSHNGQWLLRIEDLDPDREQAGATESFAPTLEKFGFEWDGEILKQSQRLEYYQAALNKLLLTHNAYFCNCSRASISERTKSAIYDAYCHQQPPHTDQPLAVRCHCQPDSVIEFEDLIQGRQQCNLTKQYGDFIIKRKEGLFAYQIAVTVDDFLQNITRVVRGSDLLLETAKQIKLQQALGYSNPTYAHIPLAVNQSGQKLSKQNLAQPLDVEQPAQQLIQALHFLGQAPDLKIKNASVEQIMEWAIQHWQLENIPQQTQVTIKNFN